MDANELAKLLSTPGAVVLAILFLYRRLERLEERVNVIAEHIGAPRPTKRKLKVKDGGAAQSQSVPILRGPLLILALAAALAFTSGCAHVTVTREGFTALTPAWPWQDSTRVIDRLNVSSKTNSFTASVRGLTETETTSTNAVDLVRSMAEGLATGAVKAAKTTP